MRKILAVAMVLVLGAATAAACGGKSTTPQQRIDGCKKRFLTGLSSASSGSSVSGTPEAKTTAQALCNDAEDEGILNDSGDASKADVHSLLVKQPQVLVPLCEAGFRTGIGGSASAVEQYLPPGGLSALASQFCSNLGPYINGSGFDREALFRDRGRAVIVPICVAAAIAGVADEPNYPFTRADSIKLFTRVCGEAWDQGYVKTDGSTDSAAVRALAAKITHEMINSGQVTVRQH
jgi:hypothetical protein